MEKGMLFNTDMVKAILEGRKTVTRRLIKPQPLSKLSYTYAAGRKKDIGKWNYPGKETWKSWGDEYRLPEGISKEELERQWTPPCHTDDLLYVRETWGIGYDGYIYKADDKLADHPLFASSTKMIYKPSIHMPKDAARIWLKVTNVRIDRIQNMTVEDSLKEGVKLSLKDMMSIDGEEVVAEHLENGDVSIHIPESRKQGAMAPFIQLWDSTIPKKGLSVYGWDANPWVWVIEFERCDAPEKEAKHEM